jgi:hypothetical protein
VPGRPALALALSALAAELLLVLAAFAVLRRALLLSLAFVATLPLAICPGSLNFFTVCPPRMWSLALIFASVWLGERSAVAARRPLVWTGLAGLGLAAACYADMFVQLMMPGAVAYFAWWIRDLPSQRRKRDAGVLLAGYIVPILGCRLGLHMGTGGVVISWANAVRNWPLFRACLAHALGLLGLVGIPVALWIAASLVGIGTILVVGGGVVALRRATPAIERRLAWCGAGWIATAMVLFLVADRAQDIYSARFLIPVVLGAPFAAAPAFGWLSRLGWGRAAAAAGLALPLAFAISTRAEYARDFSGPWPVSTYEGRAGPEMALYGELEKRGVDAALADYWLAYRLTYLWREKLVVLTLTTDDRYRPYRDAFRNARKVAVIVRDAPEGKPIEPWETLFAHAGRSFERLRVGSYTALVVDGALHPPTHAAEIRPASERLVLAPGGTTTLPVSVKNSGLYRWEATDTHLSYHLLDAKGRPLKREGPRSFFTGPVWPEDQNTVPMKVEAPAERGEYTLEIDVVWENNFWFAELGGKPARVALSVP